MKISFRSSPTYNNGYTRKMNDEIEMKITEITENQSEKVIMVKWIDFMLILNFILAISLSISFCFFSYQIETNKSFMSALIWAH